MLDGLNHLHSALRWVLLLLLVIVVTKAMLGGAKRFFEKDRKMALVVMILAHIQLLVGFAMYFMKGYHGKFDQMDNSYIRFFAMEHMAGMLIAIVLITIGYGRIKRGSSDQAKMKAVKVFYGLALVLILSFIPWPFRGEAFAGLGWF